MPSYPYSYTHTYTYAPFFSLILPILALIVIIAGGLALSASPIVFRAQPPSCMTRSTSVPSIRRNFSVHCTASRSWRL